MSAIRYSDPDPALVLPLRCREGTGTVTVHYGVGADPDGIGFGLVAAGYDPAAFRGFPVLRAEVSFSRDGYLALFGWLQMITRTTAATGETETEADLPPLLAEEDSPLAGFGYLPVFFDAPANPHHPDGDWVADTFLVAVPDVARTRRLAALTGFGWGYRLAAGKPDPLPVRPLRPDRWAAHQPQLAATYPSWSFLDSAW